MRPWQGSSAQYLPGFLWGRTSDGRELNIRWYKLKVLP